ncbi:hypothetical protein N9920_02695 [Akkermansiaceae bacterium]|nr:hypothetical protein [Akkermansiaceae bacterium]
MISHFEGGVTHRLLGEVNPEAIGVELLLTVVWQMVEEAVAENFTEKSWSPKTIFNDGGWSGCGESFPFSRIIQGDVGTVDFTDEVEVAGILLKPLARVFVDESPLSWITPRSPPSDPVQMRLQSPPAKSNVLAVSTGAWDASWTI